MEFHWNWDQSSAPAVAQRNQEKVLVQPEMGSVKPALSLPLQGFLLPLQSRLLGSFLPPTALISPCVTRGGVISPVSWLCFGTGSCSSLTFPLGKGEAQAQTAKIQPFGIPRLDLSSTPGLGPVGMS